MSMAWSDRTANWKRRPWSAEPQSVVVEVRTMRKSSASVSVHAPRAYRQSMMNMMVEHNKKPKKPTCALLVQADVDIMLIPMRYVQALKFDTKSLCGWCVADVARWAAAGGGGVHRPVEVLPPWPPMWIFEDGQQATIKIHHGEARQKAHGEEWSDCIERAHEDTRGADNVGEEKSTFRLSRGEDGERLEGTQRPICGD
mmetsp:Transcript_28729/g.88045  ORF Transcript_28729/g.88045 Transcript_28729/m.88045 type:complete len:199 (+) Transcript_28729:2991-3587(+)